MEKESAGREEFIPCAIRKRFLRVARWAVPLALVLSAYTPLGRYWWSCFFEGLSIADHLYAILDGLLILSLGCVAILKSVKHETSWEDPALKVIGIILILSVITTTLFVAPYLKDRHHLGEIKTISGELITAKEDLKVTKQDLRKSQEARLAQLEQRQSSPGTNLIAWVAAIQADNERQFIESISNREPELARLNAIASGSPVTITNDPDLQMLRAEQRRWESQNRAQKELRNIQSAQSVNLAYGTFAPLADSFVKTFTNYLAILVGGGDRVTSTYDKMPPSLYSNIDDFAQIKLETNSAWNFRMSLSSAELGWTALVASPSAGPLPQMSVAVQVDNVERPRFIFHDGRDQQNSEIGRGDNRAAGMLKTIQLFVGTYDKRFPLTNVLATQK
jgi:hypothetical protein